MSLDQTVRIKVVGIEGKEEDAVFGIIPAAVEFDIAMPRKNYLLSEMLDDGEGGAESSWGLGYIEDLLEDLRSDGIAARGLPPSGMTHLYDNVADLERDLKETIGILREAVEFARETLPEGYDPFLVYGEYY